jgi:hypothetical protein
MITLAEGDQAKNGLPVGESNQWGPKMIMQNGMLPGTIERFRDRSYRLRQAGATIWVSCLPTNGESLSGEMAGRVAKMLAGRAARLAEQWRRDTKMIMGAEDDDAPGYWHQERFDA